MKLVKTAWLSWPGFGFKDYSKLPLIIVNCTYCPVGHVELVSKLKIKLHQMQNPSVNIETFFEMKKFLNTYLILVMMAGFQEVA